jgi:hypothetical protein
MKQTQQKETTPTRRLRLGDIVAGALGLAVGLAAIAIEVARNYEFGSSRGGVVGCTYALFAIGLAVVPAVAHRAGWTPLLRVLFAVCFVLTGFFGVSYYSAGILDKANAARTAMAAYRDARSAIETAERDHAAAMAEANRITESASVADLQEIVRRERELQQIEARDRGGRGARARAHEEAEAAALGRIGPARAKADALARAAEAQHRLDQARKDAKGGAVTAAPLATLVAAQIGGNAETIGSTIDIGEPIAMVLGMLLFAALIDKSLTTLVGGLGVRRETECRLAPQQKPQKKQRRQLTDPELIELFIKTWLQPGAGEIAFGMLYDRFTEFWISHAPGRPAPTKQAISRALTAAGIGKNSRGGTKRVEAAIAA